jgi:PilZ domain.
MMEAESERRKVLRADINVFINEEAETGMTIIARAADISPQGLRYFKQMNNELMPTDDVKVEFVLPDDELPICAEGRVVHAGEGNEIQEFGIVFTWISSSDSERIRRYVLKRKQAEIFDVLHQLHVAALQS